MVFRGLMFSAHVDYSVENKSIRLTHNRLFDLSIQKIRCDIIIIIRRIRIRIILIMTVGNSLELLTFISYT